MTDLISSERGARPHERVEQPIVTSRRGHFWVPGDRVSTEFGTLQRGPMFVAWESPVEVTGAPVVLVHGGGGQGTDWLATPDGRPGWAHHLVAAGHPVYVVDRPGHGRSPYFPDVLGPMGPPISYEDLLAEFAPEDQAVRQSQWTETFDPDQVLASIGPMPVDQVHAQDVDAQRLVNLLEQIGPAFLLTHSLGGPPGWLSAARCPESVLGIVAVEPVGPLFADIPGFVHLKSGLTGARLPFVPDVDDVERAWADPGVTLRVPAYEDLPMLLVTSETSGYSDFTAEMVDFLTALGARAEWVHLPEIGIVGNGHALIYEANSAQTIEPVIEWLTDISNHVSTERDLREES